MPKRRDKNKIREVAKSYTQNGFNMTDAIKTAENGNTDYKHENSIYVKASRWRVDEELQAEIKKEIAKFDKSIMNESFVLRGLYEIINDKIAKASDKVNAYGLIAKILALTKDNAQNVAIFGDIGTKVKELQSKRLDKEVCANSIIENAPNVKV